MEVLSLIIYTKYFWDFDIWPFKRVWPLNRGPLNEGSTVLNICMRKYNENAMFVRLFQIMLHVLPPVDQPRKGWITEAVKGLRTSDFELVLLKSKVPSRLP